MVTIYQDYDDEPEDVFLPLPDELYCELYDLEMAGYKEDILFFDKRLPAKGEFLELGCGPGRITSSLASSSRAIIGIDISLEMLYRAQARGHLTHCRYCCMDMMQMGFSNRFDAILIPYNTLNLLDNEEQIRTCLRSCKGLLKNDGKLFLQLYIPDPDFTSRKERTFQFQIFDTPTGGRVIKETLKKFNETSERIEIEERYRVRPMRQDVPNKDWNHFFSIVGIASNRWKELFKACGFSIEATFRDFDGKSYEQSGSSRLIAILK